MRICILGGTRFIGRHLVEEALRRRHRVTLFNRGRSNPGLFGPAGVREVHGDRDGGIDALAGLRFDAVIDTSGYVPRIVAASARTLRDATDRYLFVSTVSVYEPAPGGVDEGSPLRRLPDPRSEDVDTYYGELKAVCERVVRDVFGPRCVVVRPGIVAGPHDPTDRFTYWVQRLRRGGEVLAPEPRGNPLQLIDVRDLSAFMLGAVEQGLDGTYNATGRPTTFAGMLDATIEALSAAAVPRWVDASFLAARGIAPGRDLPLWMPDEAAASLMRADSSRAAAAGLNLRPLGDTARAVARWVDDEHHEVTIGLEPERERDLLAAAARAGALRA